MSTRTLLAASALALTWIFSPNLQASTLVESFGEGDLHFVAAQPFLTTEDFKSPATLEEALSETLQLAESHGFLGPHSVVVFPELLGLYLYFMDEAEGIYQAESLFAAGAEMVKSRLFSPRRAFGFLGQPPFVLKGKPMDLGALFYRKLLNQKAPQVAEVYQSIFENLAREFSTIIVAGSVPLPSPYVDSAGELQVDVRGPMKNVSAVFHPDGRMDSKLTVKTRPTSYEEKDLFISKQEVSEMPVYKLPFGTLAIAICADSWYPEVYSHFELLGADFLMVPGYIAGERAGEALWHGYNFASGITAPSDVNELDLGWLTEWEAWQKYALAGRAPATTLKLALSSFMKGHLWGELFYGGPHMIVDGEVRTLVNRTHQGTIAVLRSPRPGE